MNKVYRSSIILYTLLFCISGIVLHSCKDIQEIDQFLEKNIDVFVEKGKGIKMIYSDSAKIKMILTAPVLERHIHPGREKEIFDKGILVTFMGENSNPVSWLEANTAIREVSSGKITTKGRVEFYDKDKKLETPELIWDENRQIVYTDKIVRVTDPVQGDTTYGFGFQANQNFTVFEIKKKVQGKINSNEFLGEK
ncbi:MAG: LPS export ABC transporter periplasmic protein LptC [Saprospiraceae bacterium]|nr:LPS export ABC transporter periplasmic protein LptC [Saprospiraceae bacterium]MBK8079031.1 LPS export ABC transporter periplasmic protein LptC [Saprospiraceae bacterium]MBK8547324.1 LPS export ABC transporter periplasmic protein LptC [Saprospiraceae bacterium]MBK8852665.1 LPS export ABC transporter periplasmic protein LptC [Saprospiraceae bacterium]